MIYITSDSHFGHQRSFLYEPRGFTSIEEHDEAIIKNWNETITDEDIVYHLGDVMLNDNERGLECLKQLKGQIKILRGNHDTDTRWELYKELPNVELLNYATMIKYKKFNFYLSHYPTRCSNYDDKGLRNRVINLCGHTHTKDKFADALFGVIYHCELDAHDNQPVSLDKVITDLREYWSNTACLINAFNSYGLANTIANGTSETIIPEISNCFNINNSFLESCT